LQKTAIKQKDDALALFYLARAQGDAKQYKQAEATMRRVDELVPEDWEVHYYLGRILGESGDHFGGSLHLGYSWAYAMDLKKAHIHYRQASKLAETEAQKEQLKGLEDLINARAEMKK